MKRIGRPTKDRTILKTIRTKGLWFNDRTGNLHQTLKIWVKRCDGSVDRGAYEHTGGVVPKHPTTGQPLESTGYTRGLRINPKPMGTLNRGTIYVRVNGKTWNAAMLAWKEQTGEELPKGTRIRHKDGNPWNNHISNLERVGAGTGGSYQAATRVAGVRVPLGSYKTREAAVEAVRAFRESVGAGPVQKENRYGCGSPGYFVGEIDMPVYRHELECSKKWVEENPSLFTKRFLDFCDNHPLEKWTFVITHTKGFFTLSATTKERLT